MADHRTKRVFVVDDEPVIARTLGLIFKMAGFASESYSNPLELLAACKENVPDVVLSDVMMPHMTGVDLARRMGELYPSCRVILMSGQAATSELLREAEAHGHTYEVLGKPVPPSFLIEHVREIACA